MKKFMSPLPLSKIGGIGQVTMKRLERRQLRYCCDLAEMNKMLVLEKLGASFAFYHDLVNGLDCTGVTLKEGIQKSSSRERTFQEDIKLKDCPNVVEKLVNIISKDIQGFSYRTVSIKLRFSDFTTITRDFSYSVQSSKPQAMYNAACELLSHVEDHRGTRLLGVKVSNLMQKTYDQMTISAYC